MCCLHNLVQFSLCFIPHASFSFFPVTVAGLEKKMVNVPRLKLNNGETIPAFGLGTWQVSFVKLNFFFGSFHVINLLMIIGCFLFKAEPGKVEEAVKLAIDLGYRHFDCAMIYGNEAEVGSAIRQKIADGSVERKDLYIVSKVNALLNLF